MEYEAIQKIYHNYSNFYDLLFKKVFLPRHKFAIKEMDIQPGDKILDVGVGTGLTLQCYPRDCQVTGIDLSPSMLKKAYKKKIKHGLDHVTLMEMDACNLTFDDDEFDHVVAAFVLTVVPDPVKALQEIKRVCKKGGILVLVNHFMSDNKLIAKTEKLIDPVCRKLGWRTNVALADLLDQVNLKADSCVRMKKLDIWSIVFANNTK